MSRLTLPILLALSFVLAPFTAASHARSRITTSAEIVSSELQTELLQEAADASFLAALAADFELWTVIIAPEKPTMEAESCAPVVGFFVWGLMPRPPPLDAKTRARAFDLEDDVYAELQAFLTQNPPLGYGLFRADLTTGIPELMFWDPTGLEWITVGQNQTVGGLANEYGVDKNWIIAANSLSDPNLIFAGQRLWIPEVRKDGDEFFEETVTGQGLDATSETVLEIFVNGSYSFQHNTSQVPWDHGFSDIASYIEYVKYVNPSVNIPFLVRRSNVDINPQQFGFKPSDPMGGIRPGEHALGEFPNRSQWISASERPTGATNFQGTRWFINLLKLDKNGNKVILNQELRADVEHLVAEGKISRARADMWIKAQQAWETEALIEGEIPAKAVTNVNPNYTRTMRYFRTGGRVITGVAILHSGYELKLAMDRGVNRNSYAPIVGWSMRTAGGWGSAYLGGKIGLGLGAAIGVSSGPGLFLTSAGGAIIFGTAGYFGADWVADFIDPN